MGYLATATTPERQALDQQLYSAQSTGWDANVIGSPRLSQFIPMEQHRPPSVQHGLSQFIPGSSYNDDDNDDVSVVEDDDVRFTQFLPSPLRNKHNMPQLTPFVPVAPPTSNQGGFDEDDSPRLSQFIP